ncbi:MAG: anaerobic ribonucleoside-triphosphate reductase, partial [Peptococcaceae bacterium]|nr:anaerobic ribonucleoside-triphosphate reductase [Peptococcaceae bacterium]
VLIEAGHARTAKAYILYRDKRTRMREAKGELMDAVEEILEETNRENANISNSPSAKMLQIASAASKKYYLTRLIPEEMSQAHLRGDIHIHDLDFYGKTLTCVPDFEYTLIRDSQGEVRRVKFDYFNSLVDRNRESIHFIEGAEVLDLDGYQILGRTGWTKINKVMRRKLREGECLYRIKTRKGLPLHLTGEHKVPVLRDGQEVLVQVKDIAGGDRLLTGRQEFEESLELNLNPQDVVSVDEVHGYERYVFDLETAEHWFTVNDYVVHNCIQIPLNKLLTEGFNTGHGYIRPPKRPTSATALAAIILQSSQNDMHGGQSFAFFDRDIAPFVEDADDFETYQAMEALIYNLNSMHSRAGAQVPFSSLNVGTETSEPARRVVKNLLLAYEAGLGNGENPIFPNIIFRVKEGINLNPGDPNYDLFKLAIKVASKRLNPTFSFMDSSFNKEWGTQVSYMGCRTRVMANRRGPAVTDRRGNLSFTTINLPRVAIKAERDLDNFYRRLSDIMDLAIRQLYHRYGVQAKLKVKDMPFVMGQKLYLDSEGLTPDDPIEGAIKHGTLSVGFIGLAEALTALTGRHHGEDEESQSLGREIVAFMRRKIDEACEEYDLNYTLLATPAEGLSGRFVRLDRREYGFIPGVTTKEYYTNSFHVPVDYGISTFDKISLEGPYHKYC